MKKGTESKWLYGVQGKVPQYCTLQLYSVHGGIPHKNTLYTAETTRKVYLPNFAPRGSLARIQLAPTHPLPRVDLRPWFTVYTVSSGHVDPTLPLVDVLPENISGSKPSRRNYTDQGTSDPTTGFWFLAGLCEKVLLNPEKNG